MRKNNSLFRVLMLYICHLMIEMSICKHEKTNICDRIIKQLKSGNQDELMKYIRQLESTLYQPCALQLNPKYYWAQNMSHIMVKFQFLNSADTSACDRVLSIKKNVQHSKFSLQLICLQSNFIIRYQISVKTFMPLNYYHAIWKEAQQNTIILECMKSPNPYFWKILYLKTNVPARKPRIWWKMIEKYRDNLQNYIYDLDLQEEQNDISTYVRKKKKVKYPKQLDKLQPHSSKYFYCNQNNPFHLGSWLS